VSFLDWEIPLTFNEEFFKWFEFKRWEQIKAVFKEMKRRRGSGNAIKINNAIEKLDFVLELLPYHMNPEKLPSDVSELTYKFDAKATRWRLNFAFAKEKKYVFRGDTWSPVS
jgi:hypothetical protein